MIVGQESNHDTANKARLMMTEETTDRGKGMIPSKGGVGVMACEGGGIKTRANDWGYEGADRRRGAVRDHAKGRWQTGRVRGNEEQVQRNDNEGGKKTEVRQGIRVIVENAVRSDAVKKPGRSREEKSDLRGETGNREATIKMTTKSKTRAEMEVEIGERGWSGRKGKDPVAEEKVFRY